MRKVFLSNIVLVSLVPTKYFSDDLNLNGKNYKFPLSYLINSEVKAKDEVVIITGVEKSINGKNRAEEYYALYKNEIEEILKERDVNIKFIEIWQKNKFDSLTFNEFFKEIADNIHDDDILYADITFGMKPYTISLFVALSYITKAAVNVDLDTIIYAGRYNGTDEIKDINCSQIYDLTGLFYLNALSGRAVQGQREELDNLLKFIIE